MVVCVTPNRYTISDPTKEITGVLTFKRSYSEFFGVCSKISDSWIALWSRASSHVFAMDRMMSDIGHRCESLQGTVPREATDQGCLRRTVVFEFINSRSYRFSAPRIHSHNRQVDHCPCDPVLLHSVIASPTVCLNNEHILLKRGFCCIFPPSGITMPVQAAGSSKRSLQTRSFAGSLKREPTVRL